MATQAKHLLCLYTGGTIGCVSGAQGLSPVAGVLREPIVQAAQQQGLALDWIEYPQLLDSSAMTPHDWRLIACDIDRHYADFDGFIILHGTDTLAWSAAALHWQLGSSHKPIVLTGSQRPWLQAGSDAPANIALAMQAASGPQAGVIVAFGGELLPGVAVKKLDADADRAFAAPNWSGLWPRANDRPYALQALNPDLNILAIKLYPGCEAWLASHLVHSECDALLLECYGSGNLPSLPALHTALTQLAARGTIIVAVSQCLAGEVRLGHYAAGDLLSAIGALAAGRLSIEAATTRLYTLLGRQENIATLWQNDGLML